MRPAPVGGRLEGSTGGNLFSPSPHARVNSEAGAAEAIAPRFGAFLPTGDAGKMFDPGIDTGITTTYWYKPTHGLGIDIGYHRLPGSAEANAAMDQFFGSVSGTPITGSMWTWRAFQATPHLKVAVPIRGPVVPWVRFGAGIFGVDTDLDVPVDQLQAAGWQVSRRSGDKLEYEYGYVGGAGLDFETRARLRLGLDASYHYMPAQAGAVSAFTAFTIGAHVLFALR